MKSIEITGGVISGIIAVAYMSWEIIVVIIALYAVTLFGNLTTGLLYSKQTHTYDKRKAENAVYKKAGMIAGILVMIAVDLFIMGLAKHHHMNYKSPFLSCILSGYASIHEFISMLENLKKLGNKVPTVIKDAARKAEEALNKGHLPAITDITETAKKDEDIHMN